MAGFQGFSDNVIFRSGEPKGCVITSASRKLTALSPEILQLQHDNPHRSLMRTDFSNLSFPKRPRCSRGLSPVTITVIRASLVATLAPLDHMNMEDTCNASAYCCNLYRNPRLESRALTVNKKSVSSPSTRCKKDKRTKDLNTISR